MKNPAPYKHFKTVTTADGHTATINRQETPHMMSEYRFKIIIVGTSHILTKHNEADAITAASTWRLNGRSSS